jgi:cytochrome c oxidase subunit 1
VAARSEAVYPVTWKDGKVASWLVTLDHKRIGILFVGTAALFFVLGGLLGIFRHAHVFGAGSSDQAATMYGTTMVFLVGVPIIAGLGSFLVPLMIGARRTAFPGLNAFSYWLYLLGGIVLWLSWFANGGASRAGWLSDPAAAEASVGHGQDYWIVAILLLAVSSVIAAINLVVTVRSSRAEGMTRARTPLFVWAMEAYSILLVVAMPVLAAAVTLLLLDRHAGTHSFIPPGGDPAVYDHLIWLFGHVLVYVLLLPAFGILGEIVRVFVRKPSFDYEPLVRPTLAIVGFSAFVWIYHMAVSGLGAGLDGFFLLSVMVVALPAALVVLRPGSRELRLDSPLLYALGSLGIFAFGGLTGIVVAAFHVNWKLDDSAYIVGHFQHVAFAGLVFALFAALYYWWPKMFGRMLDERLAKLSFLLLLVGVLLSFVPKHLPSLAGAVLAAVAVAVFVANVWIAHLLRKGKRVGNDPWFADTLEWYTTSPPPAHNFASVPPVTSARPLRDLRAQLAEDTE